MTEKLFTVMLHDVKESKTKRNKTKILLLFFYRKVHAFQMVITCPKLRLSVTNWFQPNIEKFELCSANNLHVSDC